MDPQHPSDRLLCEARSNACGGERQEDRPARESSLLTTEGHSGLVGYPGQGQCPPLTQASRWRLTPAQSMGWEQAVQGPGPGFRSGLASCESGDSGQGVSVSKVGSWCVGPQERELGPCSTVTVSRGLNQELSGPGGPALLSRDR